MPPSIGKEWPDSGASALGWCGKQYDKGNDYWAGVEGKQITHSEGVKASKVNQT